MPEADKAFDELKQFLAMPLVMTTPHPGETLLVYIATTNHVVSTTIVIQREEVRHTYKV